MSLTVKCLVSCLLAVCSLYALGILLSLRLPLLLPITLPSFNPFVSSSPPGPSHVLSGVAPRPPPLPAISEPAQM